MIQDCWGNVGLVVWSLTSTEGPRQRQKAIHVTSNKDVLLHRYGAVSSTTFLTESDTQSSLFKSRRLKFVGGGVLYRRERALSMLAVAAWCTEASTTDCQTATCPVVEKARARTHIARVFLAEEGEKERMHAQSLTVRLAEVRQHWQPYADRALRATYGKEARECAHKG